MVHGVGDIKVPFGIKRDAPRIAELARRGTGAADNFDQFVMRVESLNATVPELTNELVPRRVHPHVIRITQFARTGSRPAVAPDILSVRRENLDAMIAGVGHVKP